MEKETTTKKEKSKIVVLEGSKVYSKIFFKHKAGIKVILSIVATVLAMIAFITFFKDINNQVNVIKEWTTTTQYFQTTYQVFFVSEANLPIVASCILSAFIILALSNLTHVNTILNACKNAGKSRMRKEPNSNILYYEALTKQVRKAINNKYEIGTLYAKIRRQTILQAILSFLAMITMLVLGLCAYRVISDYEYAKELFLYIYNYSQDVDLANFDLLKVVFFSTVGYSVLHAIASSIINSNKRKLNDRITKKLSKVYIDVNELGSLEIAPKEKATIKTTQTITVDPNKNLAMIVSMSFNENLTYVVGYVKEVSVKIGDVVKITSRTGKVIYDKMPIIKIFTEDSSAKRKKMLETEEAFLGDYAQIVFDGNLSIKKGMHLIKLPNE